MRKYLKIAFYIISAAFFLKWLLPVKVSEEQETNIFIIYLAIAIPYIIYELMQVKKDDKANKTNVFRNRIILMFVAAIILFLSQVILNHIYQP